MTDSQSQTSWDDELAFSSGENSLQVVNITSPDADEVDCLPVAVVKIKETPIYMRPSH